VTSAKGLDETAVVSDKVEETAEVEVPPEGTEEAPKRWLRLVRVVG
jgi:hypothetical protein